MMITPPPVETGLGVPIYTKELSPGSKLSITPAALLTAGLGFLSLQIGLLINDWISKGGNLGFLEWLMGRKLFEGDGNVVNNQLASMVNPVVNRQIQALKQEKAKDYSGVYTKKYNAYIKENIPGYMDTLEDQVEMNPDNLNNARTWALNEIDKLERMYYAKEIDPSMSIVTDASYSSLQQCIDDWDYAYDLWCDKQIERREGIKVEWS